MRGAWFWWLKWIVIFWMAGAWTSGGLGYFLRILTYISCIFFSFLVVGDRVLKKTTVILYRARAQWALTGSLSVDGAYTYAPLFICLFLLFYVLLPCSTLFLLCRAPVTTLNDPCFIVLFTMSKCRCCFCCSWYLLMIHAHMIALIKKKNCLEDFWNLEGLANRLFHNWDGKSIGMENRPCTHTQAIFYVYIVVWFAYSAKKLRICHCNHPAGSGSSSQGSRLAHRSKHCLQLTDLTFLSPSLTLYLLKALLHNFSILWNW